MSYEIIIQALWLVLPAYIANASALLIGGGTPIDFGKNWKDGKLILGDGKTWRGLITGAFVGMTGGFGLSVAAKYVATSDFAFLGLNDFMGFPVKCIPGFHCDTGNCFLDKISAKWVVIFSHNVLSLCDFALNIFGSFAKVY